MLSKKARSKCTYGIISFIRISDVVSGDRHSKRVIFHGGSSNCETQLIMLSYSWVMGCTTVRNGTYYISSLSS